MPSVLPAARNSREPFRTRGTQVPKGSPPCHRAAGCARRAAKLFRSSLRPAQVIDPLIATVRSALQQHHRALFAHQRQAADDFPGHFRRFRRFSPRRLADPLPLGNIPELHALVEECQELAFGGKREVE